MPKSSRSVTSSEPTGWRLLRRQLWDTPWFLPLSVAFVALDLATLEVGSQQLLNLGPLTLMASFLFFQFWRRYRPNPIHGTRSDRMGRLLLAVSICLLSTCLVVFVREGTSSGLGAAALISAAVGVVGVNAFVFGKFVRPAVG